MNFLLRTVAAREIYTLRSSGIHSYINNNFNTLLTPPQKLLCEQKAGRGLSTALLCRRAIDAF